MIDVNTLLTGFLIFTARIGDVSINQEDPDAF
jgi:hypothetical protein